MPDTRRSAQPMLRRLIAILVTTVALASMEPARAQTPSAVGAADELRLRVISYNCWGIPAITTEWETRAPAIGRALKALQPDLVGLQEVWLREDADIIVRESGMPYHTYFDNPEDVAGASPAGNRAGLLVLSRFPLEGDRLRVYSLNGEWWYLPRPHLDWISGKGAASVRALTPLGPLPLLDTHAVAAANGDEDADDRFHSQRVVQMSELLEELEAARRAPGALPALLCGDLNSESDTAEWRMLVGLGGLRSLESEPQGASVSADRIDYVMAGSAPGFALDVASARVAPSGLIDGAHGTRIVLSDHEGVCIDLVIRRAPGSPGDARRLPPRDFIEKARADARAVLAVYIGSTTADRASVGGAGVVGLLLLLFARRLPASERRLRRALRGGAILVLILTVVGCGYYALVARPREAARVADVASHIGAWETAK